MAIREIKINAQVALSRNFDKVTLGINEEPAPMDEEDDLVFRQHVRRLFKVLHEEVERELTEVQKPKQVNKAQ